MKKIILIIGILFSIFTTAHAFEVVTNPDDFENPNDLKFYHEEEDNVQKISFDLSNVAGDSIHNEGKVAINKDGDGLVVDTEHTANIHVWNWWSIKVNKLETTDDRDQWPDGLYVAFGPVLITITSSKVDDYICNNIYIAQGPWGSSNWWLIGQQGARQDLNVKRKIKAVCQPKNDDSPPVTVWFNRDSGSYNVHIKLEYHPKIISVGLGDYDILNQRTLEHVSSINEDDPYRLSFQSGGGCDFGFDLNAKRTIRCSDGIYPYMTPDKSHMIFFCNKQSQSSSFGCPWSMPKNANGLNANLGFNIYS